MQFIESEYDPDSSPTGIKFVNSYFIREVDKKFN